MLFFFVFLVAAFSALPLYAVAAVFLLQPDALQVWEIDRIGFFIYIGAYLGPHFFFLGSLVLAQFQRIAQNRTTAERINMRINPHRYVYLKSKDFDRGTFGNCADFSCAPCRDEGLDPECGKSTADAF
jgi:hypothetical protein